MTTTEGIVQVSALASQYSLTVWNSISDFIIVIALVLLFVAFARSVGRGPFVAIILAFYCAYAVYAMFPYMSYLPTAPALTALLSQVGLYFALIIGFYIILRRVAASDFIYIGLIGLIILSFLATGFLISLMYHVFPLDTVYHFTPAIDLLFAAKQYFFLWFIAPAVGLFFLAH